MTATERVTQCRDGKLRIVKCFNDEPVLVDMEDMEWVEGHRWNWDVRVGGAYRYEPANGIADRKVWLHREIMGAVDTYGCAGFLPDGIYVGFLDKDRSNCSRANLFLYRQGDKKRAAARARAGVCGAGTANPPVGELYETLGCVCGALTRLPVKTQTGDCRCRCSKCNRRLSNDSL